MIKNINIIWLDWVNRVGKWTQADLLKEYFKKQCCEVFILKGDGSRSWDWSDIIENSYSDWWQSIQSKLKNRDNSWKYNQELWNVASKKLNEELEYVYETYLPQIIKNTWKSGLILLDRTIFSRYVRNKQYDENYDFNDLDGIIPDLLFLFNADKEVLLKRLDQSKDDNEQQYLFRKNIITQHCDLFNKTIDEIPEILKDKSIIIDATKTKEEIFNIITNSIDQRLWL